MPSRRRQRGVNDQPMDFPGYFRPAVPCFSPYMSNRNVSLVRASQSIPSRRFAISSIRWQVRPFSARASFRSSAAQLPPEKPRPHRSPRPSVVPDEEISTTSGDIGGIVLLLVFWRDSLSGQNFRLQIQRDVANRSSVHALDRHLGSIKTILAPGFL